MIKKSDLNVKYPAGRISGDPEFPKEGKPLFHDKNWEGKDYRIKEFHLDSGKLIETSKEDSFICINFNHVDRIEIELIEIVSQWNDVGIYKVIIFYPDERLWEKAVIFNTTEEGKG